MVYFGIFSQLFFYMVLGLIGVIVPILIVYVGFIMLLSMFSIRNHR